MIVTNKFYLPVKYKFFLSILFSMLYVGLIFYLTSDWFYLLVEAFNPILCWVIIFSIAIIPSFFISFIYSLLLLDKRKTYEIPNNLPNTSILIAGFNEENNISKTFDSILQQSYPGKIIVYFVNDGSIDNTVSVARDWIRNNNIDRDKFEFIILDKEENQGKAAALNYGLHHLTTKYFITIDADTKLYKNAIANIVTNIHLNNENTAAVAGTVLIRNSRKTFMTKLQEWEYFLSFAALKRAQSLLQSTLICPGAFSVFKTDVIKDMHGWDETSIGEDIVLSMGLHSKNYHVLYDTKAIAFTDAPDSYRQYFKQRQRWARGLIESFKIYPKTIFSLKLISPFIWVDLMSPIMLLMFMVVFIPGLLAALIFQWNVIVGLMTLWIIPIIFTSITIMYSQHRKIFKEIGLTIRKNQLALYVYAFLHPFIICPATVSGYWKEIFNYRKIWGTKG